MRHQWCSKGLAGLSGGFQPENHAVKIPAGNHGDSLVHEGGAQETAAVLCFIPGFRKKAVKADPDRRGVGNDQDGISAEKDIAPVFGYKGPGGCLPFEGGQQTPEGPGAGQFPELTDLGGKRKVRCWHPVMDIEQGKEEE